MPSFTQLGTGKSKDLCLIQPNFKTLAQLINNKYSYITYYLRHEPLATGFKTIFHESS